jgi:hypothetical protein
MKRTRQTMPSLKNAFAACSTSILVLWSAAALASPDPTEHPERFVRIAAFDWFKSIEDMQANFTLASALPFAVTNVEVVCTHFARSGVEVASARRTIATVLPAHGRLEVKDFDMGTIHAQASSSGCRVVSVSPA